MSDELEDKSATEEGRINDPNEMGDDSATQEERISRLETALRDAQSGFQAILRCFIDPLTFDHMDRPYALPCGHLMHGDSVDGMNKHRKRAGTAKIVSADGGRASKRQCPERCPLCQETFPASTSIATVTAVTNALEIAGNQYASMRTLFGEPEADPCCEGNTPSSPTPSELFPSAEPNGESSAVHSPTPSELFPSVEPYGESSAVPAEPDDGVVAEYRPWTTVEVRPGVFERRDSSGALRSTTVHVGGIGDPGDRAMMHIRSVQNDRVARRARREARRDAEFQWAEDYLHQVSNYPPVNSDHDSASDGNGSMDDE
jgi:hypothetical protein